MDSASLQHLFEDLWKLKAGTYCSVAGQLTVVIPAKYVLSQGKTIPKAFPGYGVAFAETSGFEAATQKCKTKN